MRLVAASVVALLMSGAFTGCLGRGGDDEDEDAQPTVVPPAVTGPVAPDDDDGEGEGDASDDVPPPVPPPPQPPMVVVAHIDTGVNPYHAIFRDASPLALQHPSTYIPGYPADAQPLDLTFDAATFEEAVAADEAVWDAAEPNQLFYVPGTRIVGMIRLCSSGCGDVRLRPDPGNDGLYDMAHYTHGTMTASRSVGPDSLAPTARFVSISCTCDEGVRWAAEEGWIDVQTNSWLSLVPPQAPDAVDATPAAFAFAAERMVTLAASGNGAAYIMGFAPTPTYVLSTAAPGVILVGAHDNGYVTLWHGQPTHVVADGFGGPRAAPDTLDGYGPDGDSCCTSAASPYAAGGAAAIILEARRLLGDLTPGIHDGVLAEAAAGVPLPAAGPLSDGDLTLDEFRALFFHTATPRPGAGPHDGLLNWAATPGSTPPEPGLPGGNPYCQGCITTPLLWSQVPADVPLHPVIGYGAIDAASVEFAKAVLAGAATEPARADVDDYYALDQQARAAILDPVAARLQALALAPPDVRVDVP